MPTTKKEDFYFGLMMCFGMVLVMSSYNLYLLGDLGSLSTSAILLQLGITFIVAFLLELFVVGPVAKKVAFNLPYDKSKKIYAILAMSTCMVTGMVLCMSMLGLVVTYLANGLSGNGILSTYLMIVLKNFVVAFPLQLLIMGPLVRGIFVKFVKNKEMKPLAN